MRNNPIQKRNSPIRDFPKILPTLFKLNLESYRLIKSSFGILIKKRFECFLDFAINIPLMKMRKASGFSLKPPA
ncbi:hypothetical protein AA974_00410 [Helicobacter pylori]|nr:hypothetical protein AA974_00410 [Helicobacter pylori]